jgi:hypothetical protein
MQILELLKLVFFYKSTKKYASIRKDSLNQDDIVKYNLLFT